MPCPPETALLDFAAGAVDAEARTGLEAHLASCERCRVAVATLASQTARTPRPPQPLFRTPLARGDQVGRYVVLSLVGEGAMGSVYGAYDPVLDRKVALKLIHPLRDDADARERLQREARAMARVAHPHLVAVHDAGEHEGSVFITMEFVDGVTLREWCSRAKRSVDELVGAFVQAGEGLAGAHAAGLVHRDFKPENVLVGRDDRVRVSDFGLARGAEDGEPLRPAELAAVTSGAPALPSLTMTGALVGTPAYMAPEQLAGARADARADQFAFCVALAEALGGRRPFEQNTAQVVARGAPTLPVPARVQQVLTRGLQADPSARFPDMAGLLAALRGPPRRPRAALAAVAGLATVAALAVGFNVGAGRSLCTGGEERVTAVWSPARRASLAQHFAALGGTVAFDLAARELDAYRSAWARQHRETCEATRVRGEQPDQVLAVRMACLDRRLLELEATLGVLATTDAAGLPRATDAVSALTPLSSCENVTALLQPVPLPDHPQAKAQVLELQRALARALALKDSGRFKEGLPVATAAAATAHAVAFLPVEAEALLLRGELAGGAGEFAAAEPMLRDAWVAATRARDDRLATRAAVGLSFTLSELSRPREADEWVWQAETVLKRVGSDFDLAARVANQQGHVLYAKTDFAGAEARYRTAWELRKEHQGAQHPMTATMLANVANARGAQDDFAGALALLQQVDAVLTPAMGPQHPKVGQLRNAIVSQYLNLGRDEEALAALDRLIPEQERALGASHGQIGRLVLNRSQALLRLHRPEEARAEAERALNLYEAAKMDLMVAESLISLGEALGELGRADDAVARLRRAREVLATSFGDEHEEISVALETEGEVLLAAGRPAPALVAFDEALTRRVAVHGADFAENALALSGQGRAQLALGNRAAAVAALTRASELLQTTPLGETIAAQVEEALKHARGLPQR